MSNNSSEIQQLLRVPWFEFTYILLIFNETKCLLLNIYIYKHHPSQNMESVMVNQTSPKAFGPPEKKKKNNGKFRAVEKKTDRETVKGSNWKA